MLLQKVSRNTAGRDFVAGDLHGQYEALMSALARVHFDKSRDRLFLLGDLVDRGEDSLKCLELVYEPWVKAVLGNHELMMQAALANDATEKAISHWLTQGGLWFFLGDPDEDRATILDALTRMPLAIELEVGARRLGLVHAEVPAEGWEIFKRAHDEESTKDLMMHVLWSRKKISKGDTSQVPGIDAIVCGHTIVSEPTQLGNVNYIDTGAFLEEGSLTLRDVRDFF